jgi:PAS domain-containing protein
VCALGDEELYATTVKSMELQTILENLTEGILTVDNQGRISSANRFCAIYWGTPESELKGRECAETLGTKAGHMTRDLIEQSLLSERAVRVRAK